MEAIRPCTTQVIPSLKTANFNYFLSVEKTLEEVLLERVH